MDFINQIKTVDFHDEADVKRLYDKAKTIEIQLANSDYNGNANNVNRLLDVTEKLENQRLAPALPVNTYRQRLNASRFIGKKYGSGGEAWENWNDTFDIESDNCLLKRLGVEPASIYQDGNPQDGSALVGLMYHNSNVRKDDEPYHFEYWLGFFTPEGTPVPEGFEFTDFPATDVAVCWLFGKGDDIFAVEPVAYEKLGKEGYAPKDDWWFERYVPHRESQDKKGNHIIDICFFC